MLQGRGGVVHGRDCGGANNPVGLIFSIALAARRKNSQNQALTRAADTMRDAKGQGLRPLVSDDDAT
jgi:hypothetical protein